MRRRIFDLAIAASVAAVAITAPGATAAVGSCSVSNVAQLTAALSNVNCDPILLAAGTYNGSAPTDAFVINRTVTVTGAGVRDTALTRTGAGDVLRIAAFASDVVTVRGLTISGATAGRGVDINGAATVNLSNVAIVGNTTTNAGGQSGAGISFSGAGATLNVTDSTIADNTENSFQGGGVADSSNGIANFTRVLFSGNRSNGTGGGGGAVSVCVTGATSNFTNVTFNNNHAKNNGGAIRNCSSATTNVVESTVSGNVADDDNTTGGGGGGIANELGTVSVRDSIIAGNSDLSGGSPDCSGTLTREGYELLGDATGCTFGGAGDTSTGYQTGVDPMLGPLDTYGGPTRTMKLLPGSPAIDAIPAAACATTQDQRTIARPQGPACDLGAFELQPTSIPPPPTDTTAPDTMIGKVKIKKDKRKAKFGFSAGEAGSTFECSLDGKPFAPCTSPRRYKHLKHGKHTFEVAATDQAGNVDPTPAKEKFKIKG